ncbi:MAG: nuclear transport factor 2 family protein [Saprospiraceae bacterium]|nr:nuclear transport factor 2 family protein [Saprospiraceae bacterium]
METKNAITAFYNAFARKDFKTMQALYADDARFEDPVFRQLDAKEVRAMWEMLILRGKDLSIEFVDVLEAGEKGSAVWKATYSFSGTGRRVVNLIHARFIIRNGKIVEHTDQFGFYQWSRQAVGLVGLLLGWTSFFHRKVATKAKRSLVQFMASKENNP